MITFKQASVLILFVQLIAFDNKDCPMTKGSIYLFHQIEQFYPAEPKLLYVQRSRNPGLSTDFPLLNFHEEHAANLEASKQ